jgi:hypothetical protein
MRPLALVRGAARAEAAGMELVMTPGTQPLRPARRRAILACAYGGYLALFVGALAAAASLVAPTGAIAPVLLGAGAGAVAIGAALWAIDARAARRGPVATVIPLRPQPVVPARAPGRTAR